MYFNPAIALPVLPYMAYYYPILFLSIYCIRISIFYFLFFIVGACASQHFNSMQEAIQTMGGIADVFEPNMESKNYHEKKYRVFLRMFQDQLKYRTIMNSN